MIAGVVHVGLGHRADVAVESRDLARLRRWEDSGGHWRVTNRGSPGSVELVTCLGDEAMEHIHSDDADLWGYIGPRYASDELEK